MDHTDELKDIIIVGYPKSGSTWVTRLVAQLVGCPSVGYLATDNAANVREGFHRESEYRCFKSHHQLHELLEINARTPNAKKIIYVVRDPRDIAISGASYFDIDRWPYLVKICKKFPEGKRRYKKFISPIVNSSSYCINRMVHAVIHGSMEINGWVRIPWATHYEPYLEKQCFFVKYEDLLNDPERECKRILEYLGIDRKDGQIRRAIEKQSFKKKKELFLKKNQPSKVKFMRAGTKEQWRKGLSGKQKILFAKILANELRLFNYPVREDV